MLSSHDIKNYLNYLVFPFYVDLNTIYTKIFIAIDSNHPLFKEDFPYEKIYIDQYNKIDKKGFFINLTDKNECNFFKTSHFIAFDPLGMTEKEMKNYFFTYPKKFYIFNGLCQKEDKIEILEKMYDLIKEKGLF